jgi:hypothetical protein
MLGSLRLQRAPRLRTALADLTAGGRASAPRSQGSQGPPLCLLCRCQRCLAGSQGGLQPRHRGSAGSESAAGLCRSRLRTLPPRLRLSQRRPSLCKLPRQPIHLRRTLLRRPLPLSQLPLEAGGAGGRRRTARRRRRRLLRRHQLQLGRLLVFLQQQHPAAQLSRHGRLLTQLQQRGQRGRARRGRQSARLWALQESELHGLLHTSNRRGSSVCRTSTEQTRWQLENGLPARAPPPADAQLHPRDWRPQ